MIDEEYFLQTHLQRRDKVKKADTILTALTDDLWHLCGFLLHSSVLLTRSFSIVYQSLFLTAPYINHHLIRPFGTCHDHRDHLSHFLSHIHPKIRKDGFTACFHKVRFLNVEKLVGHWQGWLTNSTVTIMS